MAVLDVIERDNLRANAHEVGAFLKHELAERKARCGRSATCVARVSSSASRWCPIATSNAPDRNRAIAIVNRVEGQGISHEQRWRSRNVVKIRPPLVFNREHAQQFIEAFDATLAELDG